MSATMREAFRTGVYAPTDYCPIERLQMMRFDGHKWNLFGPRIDIHVDR